MRRFIPVLCLVTLLWACEDSNEVIEPTFEPVQLLKNGDFEEGASSWYFSPATYTSTLPNHYEGELMEENENHVLSLSSPKYGNPSEFAYWAQSINIDMDTVQNLPTNPIIMFKAQLKMDDVKGEGISLAINLGNESLYVFKTTEATIEIKGSSSEYEEYELEIPFDMLIEEIEVYLVMMPETQGMVYFDNASLTIENRK